VTVDRQFGCSSLPRGAILDISGRVSTGLFWIGDRKQPAVRGRKGNPVQAGIEAPGDVAISGQKVPTQIPAT